jgi:hypothetical protein
VKQKYNRQNYGTEKRNVLLRIDEIFAEKIISTDREQVCMVGDFTKHLAFFDNWTKISLRGQAD